MKKYHANCSANNGSYLAQSIESNNLHRIIKDIRDIAEGERHIGSICAWTVYNQQDIIVAEGGIDRSGKRYRYQ